MTRSERADEWWHGKDDNNNLSHAVLPSHTKTGFCGHASLRHKTLIFGMSDMASACTIYGRIRQRFRGLWYGYGPGLGYGTSINRAIQPYFMVWGVWGGGGADRAGT